MSLHLVLVPFGCPEIRASLFRMDGVALHAEEMALAPILNVTDAAEQREERRPVVRVRRLALRVEEDNAGKDGPVRPARPDQPVAVLIYEVR